MDTARVVQQDFGPAPRRRRRPRWLAALVVAAVAAPLTSGSAIAVSGGTVAEPGAAPSPPALHHRFKLQHDGRGGRHCHHGEGRMGVRMHPLESTRQL